MQCIFCSNLLLLSEEEVLLFGPLFGLLKLRQRITERGRCEELLLASSTKPSLEVGNDLGLAYERVLFSN